MSQRQRMSPFPNYMSMESMCSELRKYVGVRLLNVLLIFEDRIMNGFTGIKDFSDAGTFILKRVKRDPNLYHTLIKKQNVLGKELARFAQESGKKIGSKTSARALFEMWAGYEKRYKEVYASYGSVWIIEDVLNGALMEMVQKRVQDIVKASNMLNVLTRQPSAMVARVEREALYDLAAKISKNANWKKMTMSAEIKDKSLNSLIRTHEKNFFWLTRDYEDPILDYSRIVERLKEALKGNPRKAYQELVDEQKKLALQQKQLVHKLKLDKKEQALFQTMRDVAHLKELRKRYVSESLYYFDGVLSEIARRNFLSIKQVRFLRTKDVKDMLLKGKDLTSEVNARITLSGWLTDGNDTKVVTGDTAAQLKKQFLVAPKDVTEFRGNPVSPGKARGPVKIVMNPNEIGKVKKGDVIVSVQVVPSFAPAILRASALICDGGHGVTTHPAVLAREAGIPAIIQTRFAREVLKDGDMVEVDGYKGVAKIVKKR